MASTISTRLVVEGEKEFKQSIKDCKEEVKLFAEQAKAAAGEVDGQATAVDKLKTAIEKQENLIKTYSERISAVEKAARDGGKSTEEMEAATRKLKTEAAKETQKLNNYKSQLEGLQKAAGDGAEKTKSLKDKLESLGGVAFDFNNIISAFGNIKSAVEGAINTVISFGNEANDTLNASYKTGYDVDTIQRMSQAEALMGWSGGTMIGAASKVASAMLDSKKNAAMAAYGLDMSQSSGDVTTQMLTKLAEEFANSGSLSTLSQELMKTVFGKDFTSMMPVIGRWGEYQKWYANAQTTSESDLRKEAEGAQAILDAEEKFKEAIETLVISLVETGFVDLVAQLVKYVADLVARLGGGVSSANDLQSDPNFTNAKQFAADQGMPDWMIPYIMGEVQKGNTKKSIIDGYRSKRFNEEDIPAYIDANFDPETAVNLQKQAEAMGITVPITGYLENDPTPHAAGITSVPFDGYPAILHRGEQVLTAYQADRYRAGTGITQNGGGSSDARLMKQFISALGAVSINMDGTRVGNLVAGTVNEAIPYL